MSSVAVCFAPDVAATLMAAGIHVVLCQPAVGGPDAPREGPGGEPGRLARFVVGPNDDPATVEEEAVAMARELFRAEPVVVLDQSEATALLAHPPTSATR